MIFWGPYWGLSILGNYLLGVFVSTPDSQWLRRRRFLNFGTPDFRSLHAMFGINAGFVNKLDALTFPDRDWRYASLRMTTMCIRHVQVDR